jgi:hypothetical protein
MRLCNLLLSSILVLSFGAEAREWELHSAGLKATVGKIRSKENSIAELIQLKKVTTDQAKMSELLTKLTVEHKELSGLYHDFETEKQHIRFEHPEEGPKVDRQYRPLKLKTLDEFEAEGGIDGKLSELKNKVKKKYGEPVSDKPVPPPNEAQIKKDEQAEKDKKRIKLSY